MPNFKPAYKLGVQFTDKAIWYANDDDVSEIEPTKSSFYDLLQITKPIKKAWIDGIEAWNDEVRLEVNLWDGHFEINGMPFQVEENPLPEMQRDLIFYRQHQHDANIEYQTKNKQINNMEEMGHRVKYFLGWKVTIRGKVYQQVVGI